MTDRSLEASMRDAVAYLDGVADDALVRRLESALLNDPCFRRAFAQLCVDAREIDELLRKSVGANELDAPAAAISPAKAAWSRRFITIAAMAAVITIAGGIWIYVSGSGSSAPPRTEPVGPVAGLMLDASSAVWQSDPVSTGTDLHGRRWLALTSGSIDIQLLGGAEVRMTGPVEAQVVDRSTCFLNHGRLDVRLDDPIGSVRVVTNRFTVVDLGTRFRVDHNEDGTSRVDVFEGEISFYLNRDTKGDSPVMRVLAGTSVVIPAEAHELADVTLVRQAQLARLIGDADSSTSTGQLAINILNGAIAHERVDYVNGPANRFITVDHPGIDGVFIPDGGQGPVQISSTGLTSSALPDTAGITYDHVWSGTPMAKASSVREGVDFNTGDHSMLGLHANKGVTFDLDAIAPTDSPGERRRFTALTGLAANATGGRVDLFVLIDGRVVYERRNITASDALDAIDLPVPHDARFLTLVATDSGGNISVDWAMFADPTFLIETPGTTAPDPTTEGDPAATHRPTPSPEI